MGGASSVPTNAAEISNISIISHQNLSAHNLATTQGKTAAATNLKRNEKEVVRLMMPVYYLPTDPTIDEVKIAQDSWNLILQDKSPEYLSRKLKNKEQGEGRGTFNYSSCMIFFYDLFYIRLFDVHPECRHLFLTGFKIQGRFLVGMIGLALSLYVDMEKYDFTLNKIAEGHYNKGIKSVEYGIIGQVLFWALRKCLGREYYTQELHEIWVKVYCRMLRTIVPKAVSFELTGETPLQQTRANQRTSFLFPERDKDTTEEVNESGVVRIGEGIEVVMLKK